MSRKKNRENKRGGKNNQNNASSWSNIPNPLGNLRHEAKLSIVGVFFVGISVILMLSSYGQAGPLGDLIFSGLSKLFGWGYYLIPLVLVGISIGFFFGETARLLGNTILGSIFFLLSALGLLDIIYDGRGGILGKIFGSLNYLFGYSASIILNVTILIASILLSLNAALRLHWMKGIFARSEEDEKTKPGETAFSEDELKEMERAEADARAEDMKNKKNDKALDKRQEMEVAERKPMEVMIAKNKTEGATIDKMPANFPGRAGKNYVPPPFSLLKTSTDKPSAGDLRANANIIKRTLESFGIPVEMGEITIGPKVTRYTLKPAEGVKINKITTLNQDLALALAAHPIRIEAPIPGKSLVGIEIPNKTASIVRLGNLVSYAEFANSPNLLTFALGRDVSGEPVFGNIAKMPHLLIAGTTGSGKSVMIHSLLISLIYKNSPETMRLILIDPKRVELSIYAGIPHLVTPVITEGKKSIAALRFAIDEMDRRYTTLASAGKRDIASYNESLKTGKDATVPRMPYLVIVIDELADLMFTFGREIENSIVRLAQMARATGIHLVLSTQRPSVDVITGLIKANISSRIALQVASQVDSKTILDNAGAEKLLGGGDMLFISSELSKPRRIQCAYISTEEITSVVDFIRKENISTDGDELKVKVEESLEKKNGGSGGDSDEDDMYDEAVATVRDAQKASASLLQRKLGVGYARAARLLDIMEENGVVGPGDGAKPREVFIEKNIE